MTISLMQYRTKTNAIGIVQREVCEAISGALEAYGLDVCMDEFEPWLSNTVYDLVSRHYEYDAAGDAHGGWDEG